MGLSIHYNGKLKSDASLEELIGDVRDVAQVYQWSSNTFADKFSEQEDGTLHDKTLYGIAFTPTRCETIFLTFSPDRRLVNPVFWLSDSMPATNIDVLHLLAVKTQFAGMDIHMIIIGLFKYLSKKYFAEFVLSDEGKFWETGNEELLREIFQRYNVLLDAVQNYLENIPSRENENIEGYIERMLRQLREKNDD